MATRHMQPEALSFALMSASQFIAGPGSAPWQSLVDCAAEPNPFLEHWFLKPSLNHIDHAPALHFATLTSSDQGLVGLMPLSVESLYGRLPLPHVRNHLHHNVFLGTPLVRAGFEQAFWSALITEADGAPWARGLICVTGLVEGGPVLAGLEAAAAAHGRSCDTVYSMSRALLESDLRATAYLETNIRKKKRKELKRLTNRLAELGRITFEILSTPQDAQAWCSEFLALEQSGWKTQSGSPMGATQSGQAFFQQILMQGLAERRLEILKLSLNDQPIAMLVNFMTLPGSFSFKIAYDEAYARYSPGVLLQLENLKLLDRAGFGWMDSCAVEDHSMINSIWAERRTLVWKAIPLAGFKRQTLFRMTRLAENGWAALKRLRGANDNRTKADD